METTYKVLDTRTGLLSLPSYATRRRAMNAADRLNHDYGAHRWSVATDYNTASPGPTQAVGAKRADAPGAES